MKNNELKELKPVYINETDYSTNDNISLVDLALILIRRKLLIIGFFIATIIIGVGFSLSQTSTTSSTYKYKTSIYIGSRTIENKTVYLEPPGALLSNIKYIYIPSSLSKSEKKYNITASLPKNSGVIILETVSSKANDQSATNLLAAISKIAVTDHRKYYDIISNNLKTMKNTPSSGTNSNNINSNPKTKDTINIALQLASLKPTSISAEPTVSEIITVKKGTNPKSILAITVISGLFIALIAAFFAEFLSKINTEIVKRKQETEEANTTH